MPELTYREALRDGMAEELRRDQEVFLIGEEIAEYEGAYKCTQGLLDEFGEKRVVDTPISELGFAGLATGASMVGMKPVVEFMTWNFAMLAIDQIVNSAAKTMYMSGGVMKCPIVFRGPNGAAARVAAQHSQDYTNWYASVPGLKVLCPATAADAKGLIKAAIRDTGPVVVLENEMLYGAKGDVPEGEDFIIPIGEANITRAGNDVTIIGYAITAVKALEAADKLAEDGINAEVIDLRSIRPLDEETILKSVAKTNRVVVAEECWSRAGIAADISAIIMEKGFDDLDAPVRRVSQKDVPLPYAENLEKMSLPQTEDIIDAVKDVLK